MSFVKQRNVHQNIPATIIINMRCFFFSPIFARAFLNPIFRINYISLIFFAYSNSFCLYTYEIFCRFFFSLAFFLFFFIFLSVCEFRPMPTSNCACQLYFIIIFLFYIRRFRPCRAQFILRDGALRARGKPIELNYARLFYITRPP